MTTFQNLKKKNRKEMTEKKVFLGLASFEM